MYWANHMGYRDVLHNSQEADALQDEYNIRHLDKLHPSNDHINPQITCDSILFPRTQMRALVDYGLPDLVI